MCAIALDKLMILGMTANTFIQRVAGGKKKKINMGNLLEGPRHEIFRKEIDPEIKLSKFTGNRR